MKKRQDPYGRERAKKAFADIGRVDSPNFNISDSAVHDQAEKPAKSAAQRAAQKENRSQYNYKKEYTPASYPSLEATAAKKRVGGRHLLGVLIAVLLAAAVAVGLFVSGVLHLGGSVTEGTCGPNLTWELNKSGVLTISGSGEMTEYASLEETPWAKIKYSDNTVNPLEKIYKVSISADVTHISSVAFAGLPSLARFSVEPGNADYMTEDGVLYSLDGSTLVLYPAGRVQTSFTVPDHVKRIAKNAFTGATLETVALPASLTELYAETFASCTALRNLTFAGNAEQWETIGGKALTLNRNVTVSITNNSGGGSGLPETISSYEFFAGSSSVKGVGTTLLADQTTVLIPKSYETAYLEVTVYATQAGMYGLTMVENHLGGLVGYVKIRNMSVPEWNNFSVGYRLAQTDPDQQDGREVGDNDYCVPTSTLERGYQDYYCYTYLQAGKNQLRISINGGSSNYSMGVYSFRLDVVSADTENTQMLLAYENSPAVGVTFSSSTESQGHFNTGAFVRRGGKYQLNITVATEGDYNFTYLGAYAGGNLALSESVGGRDTALYQETVPALGVGSNSMAMMDMGPIHLTAGSHTLTLSFSGGFINLVGLRVVPVTEEAIPPQSIDTEDTELVLKPGDIDLMPLLQVNGNSTLLDGVLSLVAGEDNRVTIKVTVEKAGVYLLKYAGISSGGAFHLYSQAFVESGKFASINTDASYGYEIADDGYSPYGLYQYLQKGENTLTLYNTKAATLSGMKLTLIAADPTMVLLSVNGSFESGVGYADTTDYYTKLYQNDALLYTFEVREAGKYRVGLLAGGAKARLDILDESGNPIGVYFDFAPGVALDTSVSRMSGSVCMAYMDTGFETAELAPGKYTLRVRGLSASPTILSQVFLTGIGDIHNSGYIYATIDFPNHLQDLSQISTEGAVDLSLTRFVGVSGMTARNTVYLKKGESNAAYFRVNASDAGLYEIRVVGKFTSKTYAFLQNPGVSGSFCHVNRDADLGETVLSDGYSAYVYYAILAPGENELKFFLYSADAEIQAVRIRRASASPAMIVGLTDSKNGLTVSSGLSNYKATQIRSSNSDTNEATYVFTATETGRYEFAAFVMNDRGTNFALKDQNGNTVTFMKAGQLENTSTAVTIDYATASAQASIKFDGSSATTAYLKSGYLVDLTAGMEYTVTASDAGGFSTLSAVCFVNNEIPTTVMNYQTPAEMPTPAYRSDSALVSTAGITTETEAPSYADRLSRPGVDTTVTTVPATDIPESSDVRKDTETVVTSTLSIRRSLSVGDTFEVRIINGKLSFTVSATEAGIYRFDFLLENVNGSLILTSSGSGNNFVVDKNTDASPDSNGYAVYTMYQYLAAGENTLTLQPEIAGVRLRTYSYQAMTSSDKVLTYRNFMSGTSAAPDRGYQQGGYYILRTGDSVATTNRLEIEETGVYYLDMLGSGNAYLQYTFTNVETGEVTSAVNTVYRLSGGNSGIADMCHVPLGLVQLNQGSYTVKLEQVGGEYAAIAISTLTYGEHTHAYQEQILVEPTCTETGLSVSGCFCGQEEPGVSSTVIPALGHVYTRPGSTEPNWQVTVEGSCVEDRKEALLCAVCGFMKEGSEKVVTVAPGHDWEEDFTVDVAADCRHDGEQSIHCKNCDVRKDITVIPANGTHDFGYTILKAPTATETGLARRVCLICGEAADPTEADAVLAKRLPLGGTVTILSGNGTATQTVFATKAGMYMISVNATSDTYVSVKNPDVAGIASLTKLKDMNLYVYLNAGENTLIFSDSTTVVDFLMLSGDVPVAVMGVNKSASAVTGTHTIGSDNFYRLQSAGVAYVTMNTVTVSEDGFYFLAGMIYVPSDIQATLTVDGKTLMTEKQLAIASAAMSGTVNGSSGTVKYAELGMIYLTAGEHVFKITQDKGNFMGVQSLILYASEIEGQHHYVETTVPPTCEEEGYTASVCTVCGALQGEKTNKQPALGHDYQPAGTPATCTEDGETYNICSRCQQEEPGSRQIVPAVGHHAWDTEYTVDREATCLTDGSKSIHCTVCDAKDPDTIVSIPATGAHIFVTHVTQPTVDATGEMTRVCSVCGASDPDFTPVTLQKRPALNGTATVTAGDGTKSLTVNATQSGFYLMSVVSPNTKLYVTVYNAAYSAAMSKTYANNGTQNNWYVYLDAGENTLTSSAAITGATFRQLTAEPMAYLLDVLNGSGESSSMESTGPKLRAHMTWTTATVTVAKDGYYLVSGLYHASYNGSTAEHIVYLTNEAGTRFDVACGTAVADAYQKAPGTVGGSSGVTKYCEIGLLYLPAGTYSLSFERVSGDYVDLAAFFLTLNTDPNHVHTFEDRVIAPTCTEEGYTVQVCTTCGFEANDHTNIQAALGHSFSDYIYNNDATCVEDGTMTRICSRCGEEETIYDPSHTATSVHNWEEKTAPSTCLVMGEVYEECSMCHSKKTLERLPYSDHSAFVYEVIQEATCTENGLKNKICGICGVVVESNIPVEASGHQYTLTAIAPTTEATGKLEYACDCGHILSTVTLQKLPSYTDVYTLDDGHVTVSGNVITVQDVQKEGFYYLELAHTYQSYYAVTSSALPGIVSGNRDSQHVNDKEGYSGNGLTVYLAVGDNTLTLTGITEVTGVRLTQVSGRYTTLLKNSMVTESNIKTPHRFAGSGSLTYENVVIGQSGFYHLAAMLGTNSNVSLSVTYTFTNAAGEDTVLTYNVKEILAAYAASGKHIEGSSGQSNFLLDLDDVLLESGVYTVTVSFQNSNFNFYGGTALTYLPAETASLPVEDGGIIK